FDVGFFFPFWFLGLAVVGCNKLKDTEWISRQDPYVCLEYGNTKYRTRTCTDGGKTPTFQEKFTFTLIEGLREINVVVWNSNTLTYDDFIGNGKVQLLKVLSQGYDDSPWSLQTKTGRQIRRRGTAHNALCKCQKPSHNICSIRTTLCSSSPSSPFIHCSSASNCVFLSTTSYDICNCTISCIPCISIIHVSSSISCLSSPTFCVPSTSPTFSISSSYISTSLAILSPRSFSWPLSTTAILKFSGRRHSNYKEIQL
ncbi:Calcium-dependent lipid-binding family protein isoform 2, partial [Theobroma cacao]